MKINTQRLPFERWHDSRKVKWNSSRKFFIARLIRFLWNPRFLRVDWWDLNTSSRDVIARYVVNELEFPNNKCRPVRVANELVVCNWRQLISVNFFYWFAGKFMFPHVACKRFSDLSHVFNILQYFTRHILSVNAIKLKPNRTFTTFYWNRRKRIEGMPWRMTSAGSRVFCSAATVLTNKNSSQSQFRSNQSISTQTAWLSTSSASPKHE